MTVIRPNSISGVTSITAQGDNISFYSSDGVSISQFNVNINATSGVSTVANLRATGVTTVSAGSTSAPSITPTGDSNTGIFFPAADTIAFAEGGTESARFDSSGRLLIGTTSARTKYANLLQVETLGGGSSYGYTTIYNANDAFGSAIALGKSRGTTIGSNTVVASGDSLGSIQFVGADGTDLESAASIEAFVDGTPGNNDMPGRLVFFTTADGAASPTERMRITNAGFVGVNVTSPAERFHINGNIRVEWSDLNRIAAVFDNSYRQGMAFDATNRQLRIFSTTADSGGSIGFYTRNGLGASDTDYGTERARIDSSGRILVGTSSVIPTFGVSPQFEVAGGEAYQANLAYRADAFAPFISIGHSRSASVGTHTILQNGDDFGTIAFVGSDGSSFVRGVSISAQVDGTPGTNDMPGRLVFSTTADGASSPTERCRISNSGGFSLGTTANPGAGAIFATGDITAFYSSDIRLKKDIKPISEPIKKLMEISGVTYKWNEEYLKDKEVDGYFVRETEVGVIAQEVEKVLPEVVATRENGYKAVRYEKLVALLIEAVKDQQHQIDELKARLEEN